MNPRFARGTGSPFRGISETSLPCADDWAGMLARLGEKRSPLSRATVRPDEPARRGSSPAEQLENERSRIARELHAGAGQPLAALRMNLELLEKWCDGGPDAPPEEVRHAVARMQGLAEAALGQVRAVSHRLHPPDWQALSLAEALLLLVRDSGIAERCSTDLQLASLPEEPPHRARVAIYRCAQECLANAIRHSGASYFRVELSASAGMVHLVVCDNGGGIPDGAGRRGGMGLISIAEHAESAGGISQISSNSDGTTIRVSVPLRED